MITKETRAVLPDGREIPLTLGYNPAHDPYGIDFTFHERGDVLVTWTISRELLGEGAQSRTFKGDGDVRVRHNQSTHKIVIDLTSHEGSAWVSVTCDVALSFLAATYAACPSGLESVDWDATIARILEGA